MDDRELLELAALAVGYEGRYIFRAGGSKGSGWPYDIVGFERVGGAMWNPLNNDGDVFRLAVDLDLPFRRAYNGTFETGNDKSGFPIWEARGEDPRAAARRALTRAAAVIGYHMKNNP